MLTVASQQANAIPDWVIAVIAVAGFLVGSIWAPWHKESKDVREKAEKLAVEAALRNQDIDQRLGTLVRVSEAFEKRIDILEKKTGNRWQW